MPPIAPPEVRMQNIRQELWSATDSEASGDRIWENESREATPRDPPSRETTSRETGGGIPAVLHPGRQANYSTLETEPNVWDEPSNATYDVNTAQGGSNQTIPQNTAPAALRPGGTVSRSETNPFKRKPRNISGQNTGNSTSTQPPPPGVPPFPELAADEPDTNPWQPALGDKGPESAPPIPNILESEPPRDVWDSLQPSRQPSPGTSASPALVSVPSEAESAGWDEDPPKAASSPVFSLPPPNEEVLEDSHAWDDLGNIDKGKAPAKNSSASNEGAAALVDDWNLIDLDGPSQPTAQKQSQQDGPVDADVEKSAVPAQKPQESKSTPPAPTAQAPRQRPRPAANGATETYQIKNINWYDSKAAKNPRTSPILVQNANGPCPLVALVNALTLTTPAETKTALVETLRSREQVSLNLLLDAVFDELMSTRRNNPDVSLPDVAELYEFLQGLHTGMNVNPRFIPTADVIRASKRTSLTHLHPAERESMIPGSFEDTKEMKLYATFSVPLIHGWLPAASDAAYKALERQAASYEDAQNLLFREEELEEKLSGNSEQGLTEEEQGVYQDILTIKSFLSLSATQLTPWGIDVIRQAMNPGSVAILFRNDHFSTLYRHPQTLELLTLVTDAGYAAHAEVVWESLVDVNGERAEFFSGDFRLVGGAGHHTQGSRFSDNAQGSSSGGDGGWTTVQGRRSRNQPQSSGPTEPPVSPKHEQEDRDLALALQLQEEEDERHRTEQARRQRESRLSEQFIEQQALQSPSSPSTVNRGGGRGGNRVRGGRGGPFGPQGAPDRRSSSSVNTMGNASNNGATRGGGSTRARGNGAPRQQTVRSLIPPPRTQAVNRPADEGLDDAPPSYEQAAKQTPYVPPEGHPSHPRSTGQGSASGSPASASRTSVASSSQPQRPQRPRPPPPQQSTGRSPYPGMAAAQGRQRDRDCVVM